MTQVSFVVTFFNKAALVADVVASLFAQTGLESFDLVLVDDGSTDETPAALARATQGHANVRSLRRDNGGPSAAMMTGIEAATGDFIKFLDGDDVLLPGATRALIDAADRLRCRVAFGDIAGYSDPTPQDALRRFPDVFDAGARVDDTLARSVKGWQINPSQLLVRRDALDQAVGPDPRVFIQDYSLILRLAHREAFARLESPVALAPQVLADRMTGNEAQILHDLTLATVFFLADHGDVAPALRRAFLTRIWGRAQKWAWRRGSSGAGFGVSVRLALLRAGLVSLHTPNHLDAAIPFARSAPIRLTEDGKAALFAMGIRHPGLQ